MASSGTCSEPCWRHWSSKPVFRTRLREEEISAADLPSSVSKTEPWEMEICLGKFQLQMRCMILGIRIITPWNRFPRDVIYSVSLRVFKSHLHVFWKSVPSHSE